MCILSLPLAFRASLSSRPQRTPPSTSSSLPTSSHPPPPPHISFSRLLLFPFHSHSSLAACISSFPTSSFAPHALLSPSSSLPPFRPPYPAPTHPSPIPPAPRLTSPSFLRPSPPHFIPPYPFHPSSSLIFSPRLLRHRQPEVFCHRKLAVIRERFLDIYIK